MLPLPVRDPAHFSINFYYNHWHSTVPKMCGAIKCCDAKKSVKLAARQFLSPPLGARRSARMMRLLQYFII
ncbi:hypothetical protein, partial [Sinorhizobium medicae]|uniref:hypothetical protein n=2 Tax=Sinorhizobium medicae TaxID=110321 RepID=UPI001AECAD61